MFLHLLAPDEKFLGPLMRVFEQAAPGRHAYVVVGAAYQEMVLPQGVIGAEGPAALRDVVMGRADWEGVTLNGLTFAAAGSSVDLLPRTTASAWYVWGHEAYGYFRKLKSHLLMAETQRVQAMLEEPPGAPGRVVRRTMGPLRNRALGIRDAFRETSSRRLLSRLNFCVSPIKEEYDLFLASGLPASVEYHPGLVGCLADYVDMGESAGAGEDFQLGNSASLWNNHVDAFPLLQGVGREKRRVVVPLGYGDVRYRDLVVAAGRRSLGDRFVPLVDFIPPAEYRRVIRSCGHVVMNHLRQQALGNIFDALWRGARVYLNDTTAYRGLRNAGFDIGSIGEELGDRERLPSLQSASPAEAARHRALLEERYALERVVGETNDLLSRLSALSRHRR